MAYRIWVVPVSASDDIPIDISTRLLWRDVCGHGREDVVVGRHIGKCFEKTTNEIGERYVLVAMLIQTGG